MKEIQVTSPKHGTKKILVDDHQYDYLNKFHWVVVQDGNTFYAVRREERPRVNGRRVRKNILMHRELMGVLGDKSYVIDHIDRNGLNNQTFNLRKCTQTQNAWNQTKRKGASSNYTGVCWAAQRRKWMAFLQIQGITNNIGFFDNEVDAAKARDAKAIELHGEFANLNFPKNA